MSYLALPPEINSALLNSGAGSEPMLTAAAGWGGLAEQLREAAAAFASRTADVANGAWQGASAEKMMTAAAPYAAWLSAAAAHSELASSQAAACAAAFEAAHAATVPPVVIAANRAVTAALANTNFFGLNFPAIAAFEALYEDMWAQDVTAMFGYHLSVSTAWGQLTQLPPIQQLLRFLPGLPCAPTTPSGVVPTEPGSPAPAPEPTPAPTPTPPPAPTPTPAPPPTAPAPKPTEPLEPGIPPRPTKPTEPVIRR
ncbi:PPE family protein [Mycobacterium riyadhense]|uniref:Putative PPE family protein PPE42 n=1 Tax=Mycobacterium riyadhense TaxID=486698 RepID=A0A653F5Y3_9MYCO|nr:PPE family protein [Mycobacterium riyadhense]VTP04551.1 putative PPE family protein PPE42 [Mycobacterium riyadhense]